MKLSMLGLAVGLGFCLLLLAYSRYSWTYDSQVPDVDRVFVMKHKRNWELGKPWFAQMPMAMREPAKSVSGIEEVTGYTNWFPFTVETPNGLRAVRSIAALPGFTQLMGIHALQGALDDALRRPDAIAMTEAAARRLFGTTQVLGRVVKLRLNAVDANVAQVRIDALLPTPPANTTIPYEVLNGFDLTLLPPWAKEEALYGRFGFQGGYLLAKLAPGASPDEVTAALQTLADNSPVAAQVPEVVKKRAGPDKFTQIRLSPLRDAYMDHEAGANFLSIDVPRGDPRLVAGLTAAGLLLLALAAINHVNLANLRVLRRQREIMLRKVLGASRRRLAWQFVKEPLTVTTMATLLGIAMALLALPAFGELVNRDLGAMRTTENLIFALGLGLVTGLLTSIYPAWIALRVQPVGILAGRDAGETLRGKRARQILSVAQLSLAIGLGSVTLAIALQTRHAMTGSVGFDPANQLVVDLPVGYSAKFDPPARAFVAELSRRPEIAGVAVTSEAAVTRENPGANDFQRPGGEVMYMAMKAVSANFFELHGIAPLAGRLFAATDNEDTANLVAVNESATRLLGFASPDLAVGQKLLMLEQNKGMVEQEIVGVAPDVRYHSLREPPGPLVYDLFGLGGTLIVRSRSSLADAERAMRDLWPKYFPNAVFPARPLADVYAENYADDARLARVLALATSIALYIAAGGAYVLAIDAVRRRTREIALRKLFGARRGHIGALVARELGSLLLIAALAALPVAGIAIARYLAPFIDRTPLAYAMLAVALLVAAAVVCAAAARQAWLAMRMRPAQALRG